MDLTNRVEQIVATIRELREAEGDGRQTRQLVDSLFRTVHSFKAAAAAEGLSDLSRTAHEFENLLHSLRTGRLSLDAEVFRVCDEITLALRGEAQVPRLAEFNARARAEVGSNLESTEFATLKDDERHRAAAAIQEGAKLYLLEAVFEVTDFDQRFRQLKEQLEKTAETISTSAEMEDAYVKFRVLYAARSPSIRVHALFNQAVRAGRMIAATLAKNVEFILLGEEVVVSEIWRDALENALLHLVRNAIDHGIESTGRVTLNVLQSSRIRILVTDNGRGIDPENLPFVFDPGFSTAKEISEVSGRGVGLDVVKQEIEALGGSVNVITRLGKFTSFVITLPNPSSDA